MDSHFTFVYSSKSKYKGILLETGDAVQFDH